MEEIKLLSPSMESANNKHDLLFENKYILTKEKFMEWGKESAFSDKRLFFAVYWLVVAIACATFGILNKTAVAFVLSLFCIYRSCIRWMVLTSRQYDMLSKQHGSNEWTRRIFFESEMIQVIDLNISAQYKYEDIVEIKEKDNYIKLIAKNDTVIRLYADSFVDSTWEECKKFILKKQTS